MIPGHYTLKVCNKCDIKRLSSVAACTRMTRQIKEGERFRRGRKYRKKGKNEHKESNLYKAWAHRDGMHGASQMYILDMLVI